MWWMTKINAETAGFSSCLKTTPQPIGRVCVEEEKKTVHLTSYLCRWITPAANAAAHRGLQTPSTVVLGQSVRHFWVAKEACAGGEGVLELTYVPLLSARLSIFSFQRVRAAIKIIPGLHGAIGNAPLTEAPPTRRGKKNNGGRRAHDSSTLADPSVLSGR